MAAQNSKTFTLVPRPGRGLVTAFSPVNMGELQDSFSAFRQLFMREHAWQARPGDTQNTVPSTSGEFRNMHVFNKITDTSGTVQSLGLAHIGSEIRDLVGNLITATVSPHEVFFETVKNRTFFSGANNPPKIWDGTTLSTWGAVGPQSVLSYIGFNQTSASSKVAAGTCTVNATATVTWASGTQFTAGATWVNKTMIINGITMVAGIASVTDVTHLVLNTAIGTTLTPGTYNFIVRYGSRSWSQPPKYAFGYYNPTTFHVTNGSPVLTLTESNVDNVDVPVTGITTNATLAGYGYTKIILYRTLRDGAQLAGLTLNPAQITGGGTIDGSGFINNSGAGPFTYTDNDGTDNNWGTLVGPAPMPITNDPPPNLKLIAYYQGRFWGVDESLQWRIRFSGDTSEVALGVPEECFPAVNFRDVNSKDGYVTSIKVIGSTLLIGTLRYTYYLAGSGQGDYQLVRLSSRGFGVNQYALDEHPGDSSDETASAIFVSRDKRLWRQFEGGKIVDIGASIQDLLDGVLALTARNPFRTVVFRVGKLWMLALGILKENASGFNHYDFYFYDFDQDAWYDWGYAATPTGSRLNSFSWAPVWQPTGDSITFLGFESGPGQYFSLFSGTVPTGLVQTSQPLDMGDRTMTKSTEVIWLWVNDPTLAWGVQVYYEDSATLVTYSLVTTANTPRNVGGIGMAFVPNDPTDWHAMRVQIQFPTGGKLYRVDGKVTLASTAPTP